MLGILKRHEVEILLKAGHSKAEVARLAGVSLCSVKRIAGKQLSERVHRCDCGLTIHRDHAAALVILGRGLRLEAETKPEVRVSVA
jgi:hypothetical protein